MALTDYDKKNLSASDQKKIQDATDRWNAANKSGDTEGMRQAAADAAAVRNNAGYKTDSSGNYSGSYSSGSNKNSQYTGSSNGIITNSNIQQKYKDQMNANSIAWHSADETEKRRLEADNKRLAALLGGSVEFDPATGTWSGISKDVITQNDILDWDDTYTNDNPKEEYSAKYDPQIEALLQEILNRDDFSYDAMNDPLYKQYAAMYQREGDRAMRETLAEAAAGAGGMNTYAITAAQQANSYYNSQLNDKIPELYQLAYEMYLKDKESKVQDLGLLQSMDATQYNRYRDTIQDYYADKNFAYGAFKDAVEQGNWETTFENNNYWANKEFDYNDMWKNKEFDYNDYWTNKQWDEQQSDKEYERNLYDQEKAYAQIMDWIDMGVTTFSDEDLAKAGLTQDKVKLLVTAAQALKNTKGTSSSSGSGGSGSGGGNGYGSGGGYDNGSLSTQQIKQLQEKLGVSADGLWGSNSQDAAGGLSADEAWDKYFGGSQGGDNTTPQVSGSTYLPITETAKNFQTVSYDCDKLYKEQGVQAAQAYLMQIKDTGAIDQVQFNLLWNRYKG